MNGGSHIRAIGPEAAQEAQTKASRDEADKPIELTEEWLIEDEYEETASPRRWWDWVAPGLAISTIVGWTAFFGWAFQSEIIAGGTPQQWIGWVINWSVPVLLVATIGLVSMRLSRREAARFGDAALQLRQEAAALEDRLSVVNRELSLAREFLGSQSRELDALGRIASERLSAHAGELQSLIQNNGAQVEAIASVSDTALANMGKLRDDLPVIANSARDVSNQLGQAGRTAHNQLDKLVAGFERINEFGQASSQQVDALSEQIDTTLARFDGQLKQIEAITEARFTALSESSDTIRAELDSREIEALAAMRGRAEELRNALNHIDEEFSAHESARLAALSERTESLRNSAQDVGAALAMAHEQAIASLETHKERLFTQTAAVVGKIDQLDQHAVAASRRRVDALFTEAAEFEEQIAARDAKFAETMGRRQDEFETREAQASEILAQRLTELDEILEERSEAQIARLQGLIEQGREIAEQVEQLDRLYGDVNEHAKSAQGTLGLGLDAMSEKLSANRDELTATGSKLGELTEAGIRLLEIIQSGARETREALPQAIEKAAEQLGSVEEKALMLKGTVEAAHERGSELNEYLITTRTSVDETDRKIAALQQRIRESSEEGEEKIGNLRSILGELEQDNERVSARAGEELRAAIVQLEEATRHAFAAIEQGATDKVGALAKEIGAKASAAIEQSLREEGNHAVERIEEANLRASTSGQEITANLRDQLAKVNELAANLEQRVARAREQAQEHVDNDFARRMALITESLNSNAIDIAKGLSQDVSDTAWAAYLKGDRGIFTRRAVRLVENTEARDIMDLFESDDAFREHVSRYIHDFEAMLRSVLSTRDGNALGVTLLSSDMGKLYVALAQSIERLRD